MALRIDPEVFDTFPDLVLGLVVAKGIDNTGSTTATEALLRTEERRIREAFSSETLSNEPRILAWREAYRAFGAKPKKYKCSVENLYRMVLDGVTLRSFSKLVDIYNYLSLKHLVPAGGDDIDRVDGDVVLTLAKGDESFIQLNSEEETHPKQGEVVYRDDKEVLCRRWNWRECDKSKMQESSTNVALVIEGLPPLAHVPEIVAELKELIIEHCGGEISTFVLDKENPVADF